MGLGLRGMFSDKEYLHSTLDIHTVRYLACKIDGYKGSFADFLDAREVWWEKYPRFKQLLHFSDEKGLLVPEHILEGVNYKNSFYLGNSNQLLRELKIIRDYLVAHQDIADEKERKSFSELYEIIKGEVENGVGIIRFS